MEVLLQKSVDKLGKLGDVVDVADGYARNYLLPKGIAVPVTPDNLRAIGKAREERIEREKEERDRVAEIAKRLEGFVCVVPARATETGHLFGSVVAEQVVQALVESGFDSIRSSSILMTRHFEELGDYRVEAMLHPEVRTTFTVRVVPFEEAVSYTHLTLPTN